MNYEYIKLVFTNESIVITIQKANSNRNTLVENE